MFSAMGLFGLSGIIVNDSIVLVSFYQLVAEGMERFQAITEACVRRLRAVLLTSITTVAGLTPILFESSLQAQFLKPMAVSLVFGLLFGTGLILLVVPAMLMLIEEQRDRFHGLGRNLAPHNWGTLLQRAWRFDPSPPPATRPSGAGRQPVVGHAARPLPATQSVRQPAPAQGSRQRRCQPAAHGPAGLLWLLMLGLGAAFLWCLFRRRQRALAWHRAGCW